MSAINPNFDWYLKAKTAQPRTQGMENNSVIAGIKFKNLKDWLAKRCPTSRLYLQVNSAVIVRLLPPASVY